MTFLQPLLLILSVLIGVPFIIHLMGEKKYEPIKFSSLKFLREIERESLQKLHVRQWLILIARALWIAMIVMALALPHLNTSKGRAESGIFVIDKSFSTSIDPDFVSFEKGLRDHYSDWVFLNYNEKTDPDSLRVRITAIVEENKLKEKNIVIVSDLQDNRQNKDILEKLQSVSEKTVVIQTPKKKTNFSLKNMDSFYDPENGRQSIKIDMARNSNDIAGQTIKIVLNGQISGLTKSDERGFALFHFTPQESGRKPCVAEAPEDDYPEDNKRYLILKNVDKIKMLVVDNGEESYYHVKAFAAMDLIDVRGITSDQLPSLNPKDYDMIWFSDLYPVSENSKRLLLEYAKDKPLMLNAGTSAGENNGWTEITGELKKNERTEGYTEIRDLKLGTPDLRVKKYHITEKLFDGVLWESGNGRPLFAKTDRQVFVMLAPFHFDWNEMGLSPYFTRALGNMITLMRGVSDMSYVAGEPIRLEGIRSVVTTPAGETFIVKDIFKETTTPGFYRIENTTGTRLVAVNISPEECVQNSFNPPPGIQVIMNEGNVSDIEKMIRGRQIQTLFLILAAIFIIFEMMLLGKGKRSK